MAGRQKKVQAALVQSKLEDFTAAAAKTPACTTNMEKFISDAVVDRSFDKVCAAAYDPLGKATGVKDPASVKASVGQSHSTLLSGSLGQLALGSPSTSAPDIGRCCALAAGLHTVSNDIADRWF